MTQFVSERISYFRTMLLETARIPSWHYSASFSLIESSCSWEMELKNFVLLESGALLKQIQEVKEEVNPDLENVRCFISKYQKGNPAHVQGTEIIRDYYPTMETIIRFSGVVARSTFMRTPVALHSPRSAAAEDYEKLVTEYLQMIGGVQDGEI